MTWTLPKTALANGWTLLPPTLRKSRDIHNRKLSLPKGSPPVPSYPALHCIRLFQRT